MLKLNLVFKRTKQSSVIETPIVDGREKPGNVLTGFFKEVLLQYSDHGVLEDVYHRLLPGTFHALFLAL